MTEQERAAMKLQFPEHYFVRVQHPLGEAIIAIPKQQRDETRMQAAELYHGATVRLQCPNQ